jgi:hypothetical protein
MTHHSPATDVVYNLVSIQYHALKGAALMDEFVEDAGTRSDVREFFEQVAKEDRRRAERCHELLKDLTQEGLEVDVRQGEKEKSSR